MKPGDSRGLFFSVVLAFAVAAVLFTWLLVEGCGAFKEGLKERQTTESRQTSQ